ncbi:MAG TPA: NAD(P)-binding domain-containing protein [Gemmatimonadales bacterium]|nr:NAD(P)-binding domain-containing protein [Gemmatimonadales bacterium]
MKVGIIGSGIVAQTLGRGFLAHGHAVMLGTRTPAKLSEWATNNPGGRIGSSVEAVQFGELLVLAVKGTAALLALQAVAAEDLAGKVVIDTTNPIVDGPPEHGLLRFFTTPEDSLMERLQREFPYTRFVKAFNSVGNARMVNPDFPQGPPTMFICGSDAKAKQVVKSVLEQFGWESEDMGGVESARAIEPLCILWCLPGFLRGEWTHAFKLLH